MEQNKMNLKRNKKSQEETVGFIIIVVIIAVIGLVFLSITLGVKKPQEQSSVEISKLLESTMYYTTDCAINFVPQYQSIEDLLIKTNDNSNQICLNNNSVLEEMNITLRRVIKNSLEISENSPNKAYKLLIYYKDLSLNEPNKNILEISEGVYSNCSSTIGGFNIISAGGGAGTINTELRVCKGG